jgi:hypothetical protein
VLLAFDADAGVVGDNNRVECFDNHVDCRLLTRWCACENLVGQHSADGFKQHSVVTENLFGAVAARREFCRNLRGNLCDDGHFLIHY